MQLESIKHLLWHGNTEEALERLETLRMRVSFLVAHSDPIQSYFDST